MRKPPIFLVTVRACSFAMMGYAVSILTFVAPNLNLCFSNQEEQAQICRFLCQRWVLVYVFLVGICAICDQSLCFRMHCQYGLNIHVGRLDNFRVMIDITITVWIALLIVAY